MLYGTLKVDTIVYTASGSDTSTTISGIANGNFPSITAVGNATAAALIPTGSTVPTNGVYLPSANTVGISTNSTQRLLIDASGNVNIDSNTLYVDATNNRVGIGTSGPNCLLEVKGGSAITTLVNSYTNCGILHQYSSTSLLAIGNDGTSPVLQGVNATNNTAKNILLNPLGGSVGIGTTPVTTLDVNGGCQITGSASGYSGGEVRLGATTADLQHSITTQSTGSPIMFFDHRGTGNAGIFAWRRGTGASSEGMRLDGSGRLLVGTSSVYSDYIGADSGFTGISSFVRNAGDGVVQFQNWASGVGLDTAGGTSIFISRCKSGTIGTHTGGALASGNPIGRIVFNTSDGTNFRSSAYITAEVDGGVSTGDVPGRLVFSTTADGASSPTERMRIRSSGLVYFNANMIEAPNWAILGDGSYTTIDSRNNVPLRMGAGGAGGGPSTQGVQLSVNATSWSTWSDERYKADLVPIADGLQKVGSLRAVTGRYKEDDESVRRSFLIAQDLQAVLPEAVDETDPDRLGLRYTEVIPLLVAALKESKERIETLEAKVAALESA